MCTLHKAPFRADTVGSFLRPERLKQARLDYSANRISKETLISIEDEEILKLVAKQKELGLKAITDGEFRRSWWHLDCFWFFDGIDKITLDAGYKFQGVESRPESAVVTGKIGFTAHPFVKHFEFLKTAVGTDDAVARQTLPAPAQCYAELFRGDNAKAAASIYPIIEDLQADLIAAYKQLILALYDAGCRNLQLDDCTWGMLCDANFWTTMVTTEYNPEKLIDLYLHLNNSVLEGLPEDLTINTHVCRGNFKSTWAASGGYDRVAKKLFGEELVNAYYLEFDTERSGDFGPLKEVAPHKKVVLGLVTSKDATLENKSAIIKRIHEAAEYVPLENLYLSPQCGFASTEEGNLLTEEQQWDKIKLIKEIADEVWGTL
ncbi:5-methyltetrahydropteroyltriglutamate--homocysteine S-methyltransferase [Neptunitalea lumnitzerae]|uniref:5-methyltetrahydropteroyltriglutamate--homocysteine methyltransferase n=1 Tax=Neptunitalea lumnitzerae TaxID=2965509 RepID=A0ABQ5MM03_9FLAO|nr:5-methyltetrahydropteroyltriglutamate--homocysteine S-methyltransferase [Neptunitalea sp. Y10]GLB50438.1 5-methyltetrahydropteroyltriglutamate--homocysteine methyltransferase [Neptunitalea sp. Y10]